MERSVEHDYIVDPNNVGYCIIINQKNFYMEQDPCLQVRITGLNSCQSLVFLFAEVQFQPEQGDNLAVLLGWQEELPDHKLESRLGTDADRDRLSETFNSLGFTVYIDENLTHSNLLATVDSALKEFVKKEHSCFVLCILSHGIHGE
jgi:hypothetical protein